MNYTITAKYHEKRGWVPYIYGPNVTWTNEAQGFTSYEQAWTWAHNALVMAEKAMTQKLGDFMRRV